MMAANDWSRTLASWIRECTFPLRGRQDGMDWYSIFNEREKVVLSRVKMVLPGIFKRYQKENPGCSLERYNERLVNEFPQGKGEETEWFCDQKTRACYAIEAHKRFATHREMVRVFKAWIRHMLPGETTRTSKLGGVVTWNTGGLAEADQPLLANMKTGRLAQIMQTVYAKCQIVLWQETGLDDQTRSKLIQYDPNLEIVSAAPMDKGRHGGAAVLWAKHRYGNPIWSATIEKGSVAAAIINTQDGPALVMSVYIRPTASARQRGATLDEIRKVLTNKRDQYTIAFVGGDFNFHAAGDDDHAAVIGMMASFGLRSATGGDKPVTFVRSNAATHTDDVFMMHPDLAGENVRIKHNIIFNSRQEAQHGMIRATITSVPYGDIDKFPKFEYTRLDVLHPTHPIASEVRQKLGDSVEPSAPDIVQKNIVAIAKAADAKLKITGDPGSNRSKFEAGVVWQVLRRKLRECGTHTWLSVRPEAIEDLNAYVRLITGSHGQHDVQPEQSKQHQLADERQNVHGDTVGSQAGEHSVAANHEDDKERGAARVLVRREQVRRAIQIIDLARLQRRTVAEYLIRPTKDGQGRAFSRLKEKSHKFDGQLTQLKKRRYAPDGEHTNCFTATLDELAKTVRANRPHLRDHGWDHDRAVSDDLQGILQWYAENAPESTCTERPKAETFLKRICYSNNSGVGVDAIPNAFYRVDPHFFADVLEWEVEYREANDHCPTAYDQALTWIPKANAGLTDECWRPLSIPTTYNRLLTGGVTEWLCETWDGALDKHQTLAGAFKEAHANYRQAQDFLHDSCDNRTSADMFGAVLFTDLVKAFELVCPNWIRAVLEARKAPNWLVKIVELYVGRRKARAKVMGRIMTAVNVCIGVDMGNALAPWIFCLALDPIVRYMNRVPGVVRMNAYMDDTNTAGIGTEWIEQAEEAWAAMAKVGLKIAQHQCVTLCVNDTITKGPSLQNLLETAHFEKGDQVKVCGKQFDGERLFAREPETLAAAIETVRDAKCSCQGGKTKLVPAVLPLTREQLLAVDNTPFGIKIVAEHDKCLGLIAHAAVVQRNDESRRVTEDDIAELAYEPFLQRVEKRADAHVFSGGVLQHKALDWQAFTVSILLYVACQYAPTRRILERAEKAQAKILGIIRLCRFERLHYVLRATGVITCRSVKATLAASVICATIRQYGAHVLTTEPSNGQQRAAAKLFDSFDDPTDDRIRSELTAKAATVDRKKACTLVKKYITLRDLSVAERIAKTELKEFAHRWATSDNEIENAIMLFRELNNKAISPPQRLTWIKMYKFYDIDHWKRSKYKYGGRMNRSKVCATCDSREGLRYPQGVFGPAYCHRHAPDYEKDQRETHRGWIDVEERAPPESCMHMPRCTMCARGQATVWHYVYECEAVRRFTGAIKAPPLWRVFKPTTVKADFIKLCNALHTVRLLLIRDGTIGKQQRVINHERTEDQTVTELLENYVRFAPGAVLTPAITAAVSSRAKSKTNVTIGDIGAAIAPEEYLFTQTGKHILVATGHIQRGACLYSATDPEFAIGRFGAGAVHLPNPTQGDRPNAEWKVDFFGTENRQTLQAITDIKPGRPIICQASNLRAPTGNNILIRFDGSLTKTRQGEIATGAGVVVYATNDLFLTEELARYAIATPGAETVLQAEIAGAERAIEIAADLVRIERFAGREVVIQGDNKNVIDFLNGKVRINSVNERDDLVQAAERIQRTGCKYRFQYIPRDYNSAADAVAKIASKAAAVGERQSDERIAGKMLNTPLLDYGDGQDPTDSLKKIIEDDGNGAPVRLHEIYSKAPIELESASDAELIQILHFLRRRKCTTEYVQAGGTSSRTRHYVRGEGITKGGVTRGTRYRMLHDHLEIDIKSCFQQVLRLGGNEQWSPLLQDTDDAIDYVTRNVNTSLDAGVVAKAILQRIVTTDATTIEHQLESEFGAHITHDLRLHLRNFERSHKEKIWQTLRDKGFGHGPPDSKLTRANRLYYACESAETVIMCCVLRHIIKEHSPRSVVWLHDGMYVKDDTPHSVINEAFREAARLVGADKIHYKIVSCREKIRGAERDENAIRNEVLQKIHEYHCDSSDTDQEQPPVVDINRPLGKFKMLIRNRTHQHE